MKNLKKANELLGQTRGYLFTVETKTLRQVALLLDIAQQIVNAQLSIVVLRKNLSEIEEDGKNEF